MQGKVDLCRGARDMVSGEQVLLTNRITPHIFTFLGWGGVKVLLRLSSNIFHKLLKVLTHILKDPPSKLARESCRHCIDATLVLSLRSLTSSRSTEVPLPALLLPLSFIKTIDFFKLSSPFLPPHYHRCHHLESNLHHYHRYDHLFWTMFDFWCCRHLFRILRMYTSRQIQSSLFSFYIGHQIRKRPSHSSKTTPDLEWPWI